MVYNFIEKSNNTSTVQPPKDIGVLHGFRALFIVLVAHFHIWQQSWLPQYFSIGNKIISLDFLARSGYIFVDGLVLLSAFFIFLPYARHLQYNTEVSSLKSYYIKKLARIVPSYELHILLTFFIIGLPYYSDLGYAMSDFFSHLTFTQTFTRQHYFISPLNGGLWTVVIEMQAYLIMPFIARAVLKKPVLIISLLCSSGWLYRLLVYNFVNNTDIFINQFPAFLDVYAIGILGAIAYVKLENMQLRKVLPSYMKVLCSSLSVIFIIICIELCKEQANALGIEGIRQSQLLLRLPLTITLMLWMLCTCFAYSSVKFLFSNKLVKYFAGISYNFYIWHQILAVQIRLAFYDTDVLHSSIKQQQGFTLFCISAALVIASLTTYYFEKPISRLILKRFLYLPKERKK